MLKYIIFAVILIIAIVITWFAAVAYRKNIAEAKLGKAEDKAREIIDEALKVAETKKREASLEAKEEALEKGGDKTGLNHESVWYITQGCSDAYVKNLSRSSHLFDGKGGCWRRESLSHH